MALDKQLRWKMETLRNCIVAFKSSRSPSKSPSRAIFLTKGSNVTACTAWDVDGRVDSMEMQFKYLEDKVNTTLAENKVDKDAFELAKSRGKALSLLFFSSA